MEPRQKSRPNPANVCDAGWQLERRRGRQQSREADASAAGERREAEEGANHSNEVISWWKPQDRVKEPISRWELSFHARRLRGVGFLSLFQRRTVRMNRSSIVSQQASVSRSPSRWRVIIHRPFTIITALADSALNILNGNNNVTP